MLQDLFVLVLASLAGSAVAYKRDLSSWNPQETAGVELADLARYGMSPKPTSSPHPRFGYIAELKRDTDVGAGTCGWLTDGRPFTCYYSWWTCTNSETIRDCCFSTDCQSSSFFTACYDSTATECSGSNSPSNAYCCSSTQYPFCVTYHYSTTATPGSLFTVWGCGNTGYSGTSEMLPEAPFTSDTSITTTDEPTTTSAPSTSSTPTSTSTLTISSSASPTSTGGGGGGGTPVGAIVGGTVGGLAVVGIIAVAAIFLFLRRRRNNQQQQQTPDASYAPMSGPPSNPPMSSYPGSPQPGMYNPHYSMVGYPPAQTSPSPSNNAGFSMPATTPPNDPYMNYAGQWAPAAVKPEDQPLNPAHQVPVHQHVNDGEVYEAPAVNTTGTGNNRAELA